MANGYRMALLGGKPRTVSEFTVLARQSGLEVVSADQQPDYSVVECCPAGTMPFDDKRLPDIPTR